ncbi:hypothetical protein Pa4123_42560 [Phytohabitans aurantiacus]|uniref:SnoaL-like domain-containing protein n=1 Tax=Phytohabitans aurantiacus TaxID=3016789 RepID=A0ABQ5QWP5_9ACTN|nr:hypothetical protein Pa4123_42560 [Phytohabitans aurantiacus]
MRGRVWERFRAANLCGVKTELDALADFFNQYGAALTAGDVPGIANCYAMPGVVVSDNYSFAFNTPVAVALSFLGASPEYQERELVAAHAQIRETQRLTGALTLVAVEWEYLDSQGRAVPGERYRYLIRMADRGPLICAVIPG